MNSGAASRNAADGRAVWCVLAGNRHRRRKNDSNDRIRQQLGLNSP